MSTTTHEAPKQSLLRLPIRNRRDLHIVTFVDEGEGRDVGELGALADVAARRTISDMVDEAAKKSWTLPPTRIVPIADRGAYAEAVQLLLEKTRNVSLAAWVRDYEAGVVTIRTRGNGGAEVTRDHVVRIVQVMFD